MISRLNDADAFSEGTQLWIVPSLGSSEWSRKLDWYLNLQLLKAERHRTQSPPPQIEAITKHLELEVFSSTVRAEAPLMIAARLFVPAEQVVVVFESESQGWLQTAYSVWKQLGRPEARMFLPPFVKVEQVDSLWPSDALIQVLA